MLRVWGLRRRAAATPDEIAASARAAGFIDVHTELLGERVIGPALRFVRERLERMAPDVPRSYHRATDIALRQAELLWRRRVLDYLVLRAIRP